MECVGRAASRIDNEDGEDIGEGEKKAFEDPGDREGEGEAGNGGNKIKNSDFETIRKTIILKSDIELKFHKLILLFY